MLDSPVGLGWEAQAISEIVAEGRADIVLLIMNATAPPTVPLRARLPVAVFSLFSKIENRLVGDGSRLFAPRSVADLVPDAQTIEVAPVRTKHTDSLPQGAIDRIRRYDLDVIIRFGFRILRGDILNLPRYGVWSLHHGDNRVNRGQPAAFWEVMLQQPTTGVTLQKLDTTLDGGTVLDRVLIPTHKTSVKRNRLELYAAGVPLIARALRKLHDGGAGAFFDEASAHARVPGFYSYPQYSTPRNAHALGLLARHALRLSARNPRSRRAPKTVGHLFYSLGPGLERRMHKYRMLRPPDGRSWTHPCAVAHEGRHYIFFEDASLSTGRTIVSLLEIEDGRAAADDRVALERPYDVSHPFVFQHGETWYMIADSRARRTVELYECAGFPEGWTLSKVLLQDVEVTGCVVLHHRGRWYLFGNVPEKTPASNAQPLVYHSADLHVDTFAALAPSVVHTGRSGSLMAGGFFTWDGALFRPSRRAAEEASGIDINRVLELSPASYREETTDAILPEWRADLVAATTLTSAGRLTVAGALVRS